MGISVGLNFDIGISEPIDSKYVVVNLTARDALLNKYEGLNTYVISEQKNYQLVGGITNDKWVPMIGGEPALGNPVTNGFVLSSTTAGVRSWIAPPSGITITPTPSSGQIAIWGGASTINGNAVLTFDGTYVRAVTATIGSSMGQGQFSSYVGGSTKMIFDPNVADGATVIAYIFDTSVALTVAGAKIASIRNATVEKFSIDKDGNVNIPTGASYKINNTSIVGEPSLGNPGSDGYVLISTAAGVRSWVGKQDASAKLTSLAALSWPLANVFIKMTGSSTFTVDTNAYVTTAAIAAYATLASPTFTGTIGLPSTNNFKIFPAAASPQAGIIGFGDGTGWNMSFAKGTDSTVKYLTIYDNGNVTATGIVASSGGDSTKWNYAINRLYSTDGSYGYGSAAPYYLSVTYDGTRWYLFATPGTPSAVRVSYADTAGSAGTVSSIDWGSVTSKPAYIMYYAGFTLDGNTMPANSTGFSYAVNSPVVGPIVHFRAESYGMQMQGDYGSGTSFYIRTQNGDAGGAWNSWKTLITSANIGSQSVGYATSSTYVTINYNNTSNSTYQMLWGSSTSVYATAGVYINPYYSYLYATNFYLTSDERLKDLIVPMPLEPLDIDYKQFVMKSNPSQIRYGAIANQVRIKHPELVMEGAGGMLTLNTIDLLMREVAYLRYKIRELENKLN
jgi:hypothetical protein